MSDTPELDNIFIESSWGTTHSSVSAAITYVHGNIHEDVSEHDKYGASVTLNAKNMKLHELFPAKQEELADLLGVAPESIRFVGDAIRIDEIMLVDSAGNQRPDLPLRLIDALEQMGKIPSDNAKQMHGEMLASFDPAMQELAYQNMLSDLDKKYSIEFTPSRLQSEAAKDSDDIATFVGSLKPRAGTQVTADELAVDTLHLREIMEKFGNVGSQSAKMAANDVAIVRDDKGKPHAQIQKQSLEGFSTDELVARDHNKVRFDLPVEAMEKLQDVMEKMKNVVKSGGPDALSAAGAKTRETVLSR